MIFPQECCTINRMPFQSHKLKLISITNILIRVCQNFFFYCNNNNNNYNNNNNKTYIVPISILLFSSALKNKKYFNKKKLLRLHKIYKVHEPTKKSSNNVNTETIKIT